MTLIINITLRLKCEGHNKLKHKQKRTVHQQTDVFNKHFTTPSRHSTILLV